ncbi:CCDC63 family protein [Megaselia abdita]
MEPLKKPEEPTIEDILFATSKKYKKLLHTKLFSRNDRIVQRGLNKNLEILRNEKSNLKAQVWVATAPVYEQEHRKHMKIIKCHIKCQEALASENKKIKLQITVLEKQILRVDKEIYDLNRKTIPDNQHIAHVAKVRKILDILQNQLDVNIKRECANCSHNARLREELIKILNNRALFNKTWRRMVNELNSGKKYLVDLVEYASATLDQSIQLYEKLNDFGRKEKREREVKISEIEEAMRMHADNQEYFNFMSTKCKKRELDDLEPREYKRRDLFINEHKKKINFYKKVIQKFLSYAGATHIYEVIEKFHHQEGLYYSYFNYSNELSLQMTNLNNGIDELYGYIKALRGKNAQKLYNQIEEIDILRLRLQNEEIKTKLNQDDKYKGEASLELLFGGLLSIFSELQCDKSSIQNLLGQDKKIDMFNVRSFLKVLEKQLNLALAKSYLQQKKTKPAKGKQVIKAVGKYLELPTLLDDIVLAQQCPECAEGEDVNPYDAEYVEPSTVGMIKKKLQEKVKQPEMQYRLHAIDQCRLPRSRILANKR